MRSDVACEPLVVLSFRLVLPIYFVFASYIFFFGEVSVGGGFQAGVLMAVSIFLWNRFVVMKRLRIELCIKLGCAGLMVFYCLGLLCVLLGGSFLDYRALANLGIAIGNVYQLGIFIAESCVAVTVCAVCLVVFSLIVNKKIEV